MAVRTAEGEVKVLSAPEDSDGDIMITQRYLYSIPSVNEYKALYS